MTRRSNGLVGLALGSLALAALLGVVYGPLSANAFVWDDWTTVVATRAQRPWSWEGVRWAFSSFVMGHYQPLTSLSHTLGERLFGDSPAASHAVNLGLHALDAGLFALVGAILLGQARAEWHPRRRTAAALLAASLFALHPLRVESVAWATERRDVLSAAFVLGSLACYLARAGSRRRGSWYAASLALFALALLSKAQVVLPAVLLALDLNPLRRVTGATSRARRAELARLVLEKLPFFALAAAASGLALRAQAASGALLDLGTHPLEARLAQAAYGLLFYVRATFALAFYPLYERPVPLDPGAPRFALSALAGALLVAALARWGRRRPALATAATTYVLFLLPVLGLFQSGVQLVADRYSYLATLGFALVAAVAIVEWAGEGTPRRLVAVAGVAGLLASWGAQSHRQVRVWRDDETVWRHVLAGGPSALAYNNLGQILAARGQYAESVVCLRRSLEVVPSYARPWPTLLQLLEAPRQVVSPESARALVPVLQAALPCRAEGPAGRYTLGLARARAGDPAGALAEFEAVRRLDPGHRGAAFHATLARSRLDGLTGRTAPH